MVVLRWLRNLARTMVMTPDPELHKVFTEYHKTHNQGVFDAYTPEMRKARHEDLISSQVFQILMVVDVS